MADKKKGYVPIYRSIKDHALWNSNEPFDYRSAWIDILLSVNHEEKKIYINGKIQIIKAGQMWTSIKKLAETWNWSRPRVYRYIKLLKSDGMIFTDGTPNGTLLTVINWGNFQTPRNTDVTSNVTTDVTTSVTSNVTSGVTQTRMIKNVNHEKECKEKKPSECPGPGWYWSDIAERWMPPPTGGGEWQ